MILDIIESDSFFCKQKGINFPLIQEVAKLFEEMSKFLRQGWRIEKLQDLCESCPDKNCSMTKEKIKGCPEILIEAAARPLFRADVERRIGQSLDIPESLLEA